jgi:Major intrinsic protein
VTAPAAHHGARSHCQARPGPPAPRGRQPRPDRVSRAGLIPSSHWEEIWQRPRNQTAIEAAATFIQLLLVFAVLASVRFHRWAPLVTGVMLTAFIITVAPLSGGGFSPVRALAPDVPAGAYPALWIYLAGPVTGSVAAAGVVLAWGGRPVTGKLRHDPAIDCQMRCGLPHRTEAVPRTDGVGAARRG